MEMAILSGLFATNGSLCGKLAGFYEFFGTLESVLMKILLMVLMVASNTIGCAFFVKALNSSKSSVPATVASAATNYIFSAALGILFFGESSSLCWWCGTSLVLMGLLVIRSAPDEATVVDSKYKVE